MIKRLSILIIVCFSMLSSCRSSCEVVIPDWEVPPNDLTLVFPNNKEVFYNDQKVAIEDYITEYFDSEDAISSNPILLDKVYFGGYLLDDSESTSILHYALFSIDIDGSDPVEMVHDEITYPSDSHFYFSEIRLWDVYENKVFFQAYRFMLVADLTLQDTVFQSIFSFISYESEDNINPSNYSYLGDGKMVRLAKEGVYRILPNSGTGIYEEVLYPAELSYLAYAWVLIDGIIIIEDRIYADGNWDTRILKGVSYEEGTWVDEATCQALLDSIPEEVHNPYYSFRNNNTTFGSVSITVTRKEDQVSRNFTKASLIRLYPGLRKFYAMGNFSLASIGGRNETLYVSLHRKRVCEENGHNIIRKDLFLFSYDWEDNTLTYLGFYERGGNDALWIFNPQENRSELP